MAASSNAARTPSFSRTVRYTRRSTANSSWQPRAASSRPSDVSEDARATLDELAAAIRQHFGRRLAGLYLFGSLAAGGFHQGRSDLDLIAVLDSGVAEGPDLDALRT